MKANECRVGNYYDHNGEIEKITPNVISEIWDAERTWCNPIKLTCDWLEKLGFKKQYDETVYDIGNTRIELIIWGDSEPEWKIKRILGSDLSYWRHGMPAIQYVHQLQNLYFALTGEELTTTNL